MKERTTVQTSLLGIAKKARTDKQYRFRNLYRDLKEELLRDSWRLLRKDAALGVDQVSAAEYEAKPGQAGTAALYSEGRGQMAALGNTSHRRQAAAGGSEATAGSNLRAGLS